MKTLLTPSIRRQISPTEQRIEQRAQLNYAKDVAEAKATRRFIGDYTAMEWRYLSDARKQVEAEKAQLRGD